MDLTCENDAAILEEFVNREVNIVLQPKTIVLTPFEGGEVSNYEIITDNAEDDENDVPAPDRAVGACVKAGKTDRWVEIPRGSRYDVQAGEVELYVGEG